MLYPVELRGHEGSQNKSVATPERKMYYVRSKIWGGKRESNPQPPEPQSGALPVELFPPHLLIITTEIRGCQNGRAPVSEIQNKNFVIPTPSGAQRAELRACPERARLIE